MNFLDKSYKHIVNFFKGIAIAVAMLVPGVSGGTMALILGIYHKILNAVSCFFKDIKGNIIFLGVLGLGAVAGVFGFAKIIMFFLANYEFPTVYFFLGLIIGGMPILFKESNQGKKTKYDLIFLVIGFAIILAFTALGGKYIDGAGTDGIIKWIFFLVAGFFVAIALILPGISTTFFLMALGLYEGVLAAIDSFDIMYLLPIAIGAVLGIVLTAKVLENFLTKRPRQTYLLIIGFVFGSFIEVIPGIPSGLDILWSVITLAAGCALVLFLTKLSIRKAAVSSGAPLQDIKQIDKEKTENKA